MTEFISHRQRVEVKEYEISYTWKDDPGAGFGFPCTPEGEIITEELKAPALENLKKCQDGTYNVNPPVLVDLSYHYYDAAVIKCDVCSGRVSLDDAETNHCPGCGTLYNGFGQRLAPRDQWEEDY